MAKKKNNVSINALERYCNGEGENVLTRTIKALNGEEVTYEVKKRLSFEECARFVEDVVKECIVLSADLIVPISKQFVIRRNLMTYYANFTMPVSMVKAFDLVMASGDIIDDILSVIDSYQYYMIENAIVERLDFEKNRMLSVQEAKANQLLAEVAKFMEKMETLFDNIDGNQMTQFINSMSNLDMNNVSKEDLASALMSAVKDKE